MAGHKSGSGCSGKEGIRKKSRSHDEGQVDVRGVERGQPCLQHVEVAHKICARLCRPGTCTWHVAFAWQA
eukprot:6175426-Pleurochrysis_carterae.AAC.1